MSVNSKMTAIADEIRTLSGTTETLGLDAMATNIGAANIEIGDQTDLIAQIASALEGKAGGEGGGGASFDTCTVTFDNEFSQLDPIRVIFATTVEDGEVKTHSYVTPNSQFSYLHTIENIKCGTHIYFFPELYSTGGFEVMEIDGTATYDDFINLSNLGTAVRLVVFTAPKVANENCTITYASIG